MREVVRLYKFMNFLELIFLVVQHDQNVVQADVVVLQSKRWRLQQRFACFNSCFIQEELSNPKLMIIIQHEKFE